MRRLALFNILAMALMSIVWAFMLILSYAEARRHGTQQHNTTAVCCVVSEEGSHAN
jgi:hypothetical protein